MKVATSTTWSGSRQRQGRHISCCSSSGRCSAPQPQGEFHKHACNQHHGPASYVWTCCRKTWQRHMEKHGGVVLASKQQLVSLHEGKHIAPKTNVVMLLSMSSALAGLKVWGLSYARLELLQRSVSSPTHCVFTSEVLDTARPRPTQLPECDLGEHWMRKQYGLGNREQQELLKR